jgi:predicted Fe-Mo cluster-binding NifX family protein
VSQSFTIALPVSEEQVATHFGHAPKFAMFDVDQEKKVIQDVRLIDAPPHQPGMLPGWLAERGANLVITGGMGQRAVSLFAERGIQVVMGAPEAEPRAIVESYLAGTLPSGQNLCDH